jgi:hypothetical protein
MLGPRPRSTSDWTHRNASGLSATPGRQSHVDTTVAAIQFLGQEGPGRARARQPGAAAKSRAAGRVADSSQLVVSAYYCQFTRPFVPSGG